MVTAAVVSSETSDCREGTETERLSKILVARKGFSLEKTQIWLISKARPS